MKYLIVGLGNVGSDYDGTRHNIGSQIIESINAENKVEETTLKYARYSHVKYKNRQLHLIIPTTFMNNSGKAVKYWSDFLKIQLKNVLVVTDDISLPFNKIRLKPKGSSGGHNGLKSIENYLNTQHYARLKIGIGNDFKKYQQDIFVLNKFTNQEQKEIPNIISKAKDIIFSFTFKGIQNTMNCYN